MTSPDDPPFLALVNYLEAEFEEKGFVKIHTNILSPIHRASLPLPVDGIERLLKLFEAHGKTNCYRLDPQAFSHLLQIIIKLEPSLRQERLLHTLRDSIAAWSQSKIQRTIIARLEEKGISASDIDKTQHVGCSTIFLWLMNHFTKEFRQQPLSIIAGLFLSTLCQYQAPAIRSSLDQALQNYGPALRQAITTEEDVHRRILAANIVRHLLQGRDQTTTNWPQDNLSSIFDEFPVREWPDRLWLQQLLGFFAKVDANVKSNDIDQRHPVVALRKLNIPDRNITESDTFIVASISTRLMLLLPANGDHGIQYITLEGIEGIETLETGEGHQSEFDDPVELIVNMSSKGFSVKDGVKRATTQAMIVPINESNEVCEKLLSISSFQDHDQKVKEANGTPRVILNASPPHSEVSRATKGKTRRFAYFQSIHALDFSAETESTSQGSIPGSLRSDTLDSPGLVFGDEEHSEYRDFDDEFMTLAGMAYAQSQTRHHPLRNTHHDSRKSRQGSTTNLDANENSKPNNGDLRPEVQTSEEVIEDSYGTKSHISKLMQDESSVGFRASMANILNTIDLAEPTTQLSGLGLLQQLRSPSEKWSEYDRGLALGNTSLCSDEPLNKITMQHKQPESVAPSISRHVGGPKCPPNSDAVGVSGQKSINHKRWRLVDTLCMEPAEEINGKSGDGIEDWVGGDAPEEDLSGAVQGLPRNSAATMDSVAISLDVTKVRTTTTKPNPPIVDVTLNDRGAESQQESNSVNNDDGVVQQATYAEGKTAGSLTRPNKAVAKIMPNPEPEHKGKGKGEKKPKHTRERRSHWKKPPKAKEKPAASRLSIATAKKLPLASNVLLTKIEKSAPTKPENDSSRREEVSIPKTVGGNVARSLSLESPKADVVGPKHTVFETSYSTYHQSATPTPIHGGFRGPGVEDSLSRNGNGPRLELRTPNNRKLPKAPDIDLDFRKTNIVHFSPSAVGKSSIQTRRSRQVRYELVPTSTLSETENHAKYKKRKIAPSGDVRQGIDTTPSKRRQSRDANLEPDEIDKDQGILATASDDLSDSVMPRLEWGKSDLAAQTEMLEEQELTVPSHNADYPSHMDTSPSFNSPGHSSASHTASEVPVQNIPTFTTQSPFLSDSGVIGCEATKSETKLKLGVNDTESVLNQRSSLDTLHLGLAERSAVTLQGSAQPSLLPPQLSENAVIRSIPHNSPQSKSVSRTGTSPVVQSGNPPIQEIYKNLEEPATTSSKEVGLVLSGEPLSLDGLAGFEYPRIKLPGSKESWHKDIGDPLVTELDTAVASKAKKDSRSSISELLPSKILAPSVQKHMSPNQSKEKLTFFQNSEELKATSGSLTCAPLVTESITQKGEPFKSNHSRFVELSSTADHTYTPLQSSRDNENLVSGSLKRSIQGIGLTSMETSTPPRKTSREVNIPEGSDLRTSPSFRRFQSLMEQPLGQIENCRNEPSFTSKVSSSTQQSLAAIRSTRPRTFPSGSQHEPGLQVSIGNVDRLPMKPVMLPPPRPARANAYSQGVSQLGEASIDRRPMQSDNKAGVVKRVEPVTPPAISPPTSVHSQASFFTEFRRDNTNPHTTTPSLADHSGWHSIDDERDTTLVAPGSATSEEIANGKHIAVSDFSFKDAFLPPDIQSKRQGQKNTPYEHTAGDRGKYGSLFSAMNAATEGIVSRLSVGETLVLEKCKAFDEGANIMIRHLLDRQREDFKKQKAEVTPWSKELSVLYSSIRERASQITLQKNQASQKMSSYKVLFEELSELTSTLAQDNS